MDTLCLIKSLSDKLNREGICICRNGAVVYFNNAFGKINSQIENGEDINEFYSENIDIYFSVKNGRRYDIKRIDIDKETFVLIYRECEEMADDEKERFVSFYKMSHDLRSPLNAILSASVYALKNDMENSKELMEKIKNTADYMIEVVNSVLKRAEKEHNKDIKFSLRQTVEQAEEICRINARKKHQKMSFDIDNDYFFEGNGLILKQIIINLASNAVKYTDEGGDVKVKIYSENGEEEYIKTVKLSVEDNGQGIDKQTIEKIFMPFGKNCGHSRENSSGLGLSITKEKVEALGGKIYVESEKGRGSKFFVEIPFKVIEN